MTSTAPPDATNKRTGYSVCSICDIGCQLRTTAKDGLVERIQAHDSPALARNICYKGTAAPHIHNHADRLRVPLKRVGARGEDRWVAMACRSDDEWRALCDVMERPDLVARRDETEVVDAAIVEWTRVREASEIEQLLQSRGVPVHEALQTPDLHEDPQLRLREHFIEIEHEIFPTTTVESTRLVLSRSKPRVPERSLSVGRDNQRVLEEVLGYSADQIAALQGSEVLR